MSREHILTEIDVERSRQDELWGHEFDDKNTINDFGSYITRYVSEATFADSPERQREQLIKVAALSIATLEAFDRNNGFARRHYDE